jgi:hypothetical protein
MQAGAPLRFKVCVGLAKTSQCREHCKEHYARQLESVSHKRIYRVYRRASSSADAPISENFSIHTARTRKIPREIR